MSEIDSNDDGFIDLHKFIDFHRKGSDDDDESSSKELCYVFDLYDQDGNGLISAKKLHIVLKSLGEKCSWRDCLKMIESVDVDGNGCINFEKFKKIMKA
ncbi:probable calcium-binding protein CML18 [Camellia sinensis]|uniref:probable calcium-binding protein CML18 n=1 Tax=Camellia sinensis TaxID=4442 RepID=UPI0010361C25|nr:probable calcium-binding protein CML18 [Camellia sinensis]